MIVRILGGLLLLALLVIGVQTWRLDKAQDYHKEYVAEIKDKLVEAYKKNNQERIRAEQAEAQADVKYLEGKKDAKKLHDAVTADLRTDNQRLQKHWREALRRLNQTTASTANSGGDGQADAVSSDLARFVQRAAEGDAKIMRLQDRIDNYLKQVNGEGWYEQQEQ